MAYSSHKHKEIYDVANLDLQKVAQGFGLSAPPKVNLNVKVSGKTARNSKVRELLGKRKMQYSTSMEQGKKGDSRQFSH
jgi:ATP-dependent RNA helicase DDX18/HAS1